MAADSFIFGGNTGLTYEQLKRRRAVAAALASQRRGYPKTVGEGMTYLGESIGDMIAERRLDTAEKEYMARQEQLMAPTMPGVAPAAPMSAPARPGAAPTPIGPRPAPPPPVRPPPAPVPPRPQVSMVPVTPTPSDPYGATEGTGEGFEPGGILNPTPMAAELASPPGMRGDLYPSEGTPPSTFIPSTAAAPPSNAPAPATAPPVSAMDFASWPQGPIGRPTDTVVEPGVTTPPAAPPAAPAGAGAALGPQSDLTGFIAKQEGFRPTAYSDYKQTSIGYGTRGTPGETITREEAQRRLESEVAKARGYVEAFAPEAPPGVKDALTSLTYNAGPGWQQAGLGKLIKEGRYDEARDRFTQYNKAGGSTLPGLVSRRNAEISQLWDQAGSAAPPDERLALERPLPQRGGEGMTLASYAQPGMRSDAPPPGIGSAGGNIRFQSDPFQPPAGAAPAAPDEQVTPTNIEPMPPTAQLQAGQLGQLGPPTGRFSEAPLPGVVAPVAPAPQAPAVAPRPPQEPPPAARPTVSEEYTRQLPEPTPPDYPAQLNAKEIQGWRIKTMSGGDQALAQHGEMLMNQGKAERETPYLRAVEQYKVELQAIRAENAARAKYQREQPTTEQAYRKGEEEVAGKRRESGIAERFGSVHTYDKLVEGVGKSHEKASAAASVLPNLYDAKEMAKNAITGFGANARLDYNRALNYFGITATGDKVRDTQALQAAIAPLVGAILKSTTGTTQVSEGDRKFAQAAAGGDITLDAPAIQRILDIGERSFKANIAEHNKQLSGVFTDPQGQDRALHARYRVEMPLSTADQAAQEWLAQNPNDPRAAGVRRKLGIQ